MRMKEEEEKMGIEALLARLKLVCKFSANLNSYFLTQLTLSLASQMSLSMETPCFVAMLCPLRCRLILINGSCTK